MSPDQQAPWELRPLLREVRRLSNVDVVMAATVPPGGSELVIDQLLGVTSDSMRNLTVIRGEGLGGKAVLAGKPVQVRDYCQARGITHQYDVAVRTERLQAMFAVPLSVRGGPQGVVYGALRRAELFGDRLLEPVIAAVRRFERLTLQERETKSALIEGSAALQGCTTGRGIDDAHATRLLDIRAELDHISSLLPPGAARDAVEALVYQVSRAVEPLSVARAAPRLSKREREYVAQVACGLTNAEIAERLHVGVETVKSGLRSGMRKLQVHNRVQLVRKASELGEV